jgi:hypothetical protein
MRCARSWAARAEKVFSSNPSASSEAAGSTEPCLNALGFGLGIGLVWAASKGFAFSDSGVFFLNALGFGLGIGLVWAASKGFPFSDSGVVLNNEVRLVFLECAGLVPECVGGETVREILGERDLSCRVGTLDLLFAASLASLVLLKRTRPRLIAGTSWVLADLLGFALDSGLEESSLYPRRRPRVSSAERYSLDIVR